MYKISIFNNDIETIVNYPSSNMEDPHVSSASLKEGLSIVDSLSFSLYSNNPAYNKVFELQTKVKVFDLRDNTVRFTGRIINIDEQMDNTGKLYKSIMCEGALSFFNDTKVRNAIVFTNTKDFITKILTLHNSKVGVDKRIQIGNVQVINIGSGIDGGFRTTLQVLKEFSDIFEGDIRIREVNKILYLDWLQSFTSSVIDVSLGVNMKDMIKQKDITSIGTRIIPLGANNITINSVNSGLDYIDVPSAISIYGIIEKTIEYRDITDLTILKNTCISDLNKHTQPFYMLESNALDLSYLTGNKAEQFVLGLGIHLINPIMGIDSIYKIVGLDVDLIQPYNPKLTIANSKIQLTNTITDLRNSTIQQDGVYNNVQIGSSFGIRVVKTDGKAITTLNATDGIKIQTNRGSGLVDSFYVDTNGNLKINTYDEITGNLSSGLNVANNKISAVVQTSNGGASYELNSNEFKLAFSKSSNGYTSIGGDGITIYDGRFKIKKGSDTVFYVNTSGRCTADGGFIVYDNGVSSELNSDGLFITNVDGFEGVLQAYDRSNTLYTPSDFHMGEDLFVNGHTVIGDWCDVETDLWVGGDLDVEGAKPCLQLTKNYGKRRITAYETAEYWFGDIGNGCIKDGECVVFIEDIFSECVNTEVEYQVEIFEYTKRGSITDIERHPTHFIVKGDLDDIEFGWELKAKRIGYENDRLEQKLDKELKTNDVENSLLELDRNDLINILLEEVI